MLGLLARYRGVIVVGVLLLMPLILLYAQTKRPGARGPVVGLVLDGASVIERVMLFFVGGLVDGFDKYVISLGDRDEVFTLRRERQSAEGLRSRLKELEVENEEMRALARAAVRIEGPRPLGARVLARTGYPLTLLVTIDVGTSDGVRRGDGVVDKNGVVGVVSATGRRTCDVMLLSDPSSSIDVLSQRTRARGVLRGEDSGERYGAEVEDFDKLRDVKPGDTLVTSGIATRFPAGLLVGTVIEATAPDDSLYLRAKVRPAARFDTLEHVLVLVHREPPRSPRIGREQDEDEPLPLDGGPVPLKPYFGKPAVKGPDAGMAVDAGPPVDAGPLAPAADAGVAVVSTDAGSVAPAAPPVAPPVPPASPPTAPLPTLHDAGTP